MNCLEAQERIQQWLDGEAADAGWDDFATHLVICPECREQYTAAQCLMDGLRLLPRSHPSAGLAERICRQLLVERSRAQRFRRLLVTSAVAASLLLASFIMYRASPSLSLAEQLARPSIPAQFRGPRSSTSLHDTLEEARLAIVALTRRTADDVSASGVALAPRGLGSLPQPRSLTGETDEVEKVLGQALEPSAQSLQVLRRDMVASLEPMALSARRALDFFWHEISAMENNVE
jgi:hypothetical protein